MWVGTWGVMHLQVRLHAPPISPLLGYLASWGLLDTELNAPRRLMTRRSCGFQVDLGTQPTASRGPYSTALAVLYSTGRHFRSNKNFTWRKGRLKSTNGVGGE